MVSAMNTRLSLKRMWLHSHEPTNMTQYMTTMAVRIIAANRRYIAADVRGLSSSECW